MLTPHRSLGPTGFLVLMAALSGISFVTGLAFYLVGAWPVMGFFGLDVALVYFAFRLNYRSGRLYETVELDPARLTWTRVHPSGRREQFDCNPYWARVNLREWPDGRTDLQNRVAGPGAGLRPLPHRRRAARFCVRAEGSSWWTPAAARAFEEMPTRNGSKSDVAIH